MPITQSRMLALVGAATILSETIETLHRLARENPTLISELNRIMEGLDESDNRRVTLLSASSTLAMITETLAETILATADAKACVSVEKTLFERNAKRNEYSRAYQQRRRALRETPQAAAPHIVFVEADPDIESAAKLEAALLRKHPGRLAGQSSADDANITSSLPTIAQVNAEGIIEPGKPVF
jgi:hypothetical protein